MQGVKWWTNNDYLVYKKLDRNEFVDFDEWFKQIKCRSVMDCPTILYWDKIFEQYPNCKVIVPVFEYEKWYPSMVNLTNVIFSKPFTFSAKFLKLCQMVQNEYWPRLFNHKIDEFMDDNKYDFARKYYNEKLQKIKFIVPEEQLLLFDVRDGWEPLCKFLDVPIPNMPYPSANIRGVIKQKVYFAVVFILCKCLCPIIMVAVAIGLLIYFV